MISRQSFTHALLHLAAHPEYILPLREEVERVIESEGWTKTAMQKIRKVDSFLRESQRFNGIGQSTSVQSFSHLTVSNELHFTNENSVYDPKSAGGLHSF